MIAATGFRAPVRDLPAIGVAMVNDGRMPAQTPYWESISVPGDLLRRKRDGCVGRPAQARRDVSAASVNGFRYNVRVLAQHIAEKHFGLARERRQLARDEVVPFLLGELARAPELWIQKGYLARVVETDGGFRDGGIVPLADHVDRDGGDSCRRHGRVRSRRSGHPGRLRAPQRAALRARAADAPAARIRYRRAPPAARGAHLLTRARSGVNATG